MMKYASLVILGLLFGGGAFADLPNKDRHVTKVEVRSGAGIVVISVDGAAVVDAPSACSSLAKTSCALGTASCEMITSLALSARLSGELVEFTNSTSSCNGSIAVVNWFRIQAPE